MATIPIQSISILGTDYTFQQSRTQELIITIEPENATNPELDFTISNENIVTVTKISNTYYLNGISIGGPVTVQAKARENNSIVSNTINVNVTEFIPDILVQTIILTPEPNTTTIDINDESIHMIMAEVRPSDATNPFLDWESDDPTTVFVDSAGIIAPRKVGTAKITALATDTSGVSAYINITVIDSSVIKVQSINLSVESSTIDINNKTTRIIAAVTPQNATNKVLTWSSNNTNIATVDSSGLITPKSTGNVTITASATDGSGVKATKQITITISINSISITPSPIYMNVGEYVKPNITITPSNATNKSLIWEYDTDLLNFNYYTNEIYAKSAGNTTFIVKSNDGSDVTTSVPVYISDSNNIFIQDFIITPNSIICNHGETIEFSVDITPKNASNKNISIQSLNPYLVTVNAFGIATANSNNLSGVTKIKFSTNDNTKLVKFVSVTVQNKVIIPVNKILLKEPSKILNKDNILYIPYTLEPADATNKKLSWLSSNSNIVSVDENGKITCKKGGEAIITATSNDNSNITNSITITVNNRVQYIFFSETNLTITNSNSYEIKLTLLPSNYLINNVIQVINNDPDILSLTKSDTNYNFMVKGKKNGSARITAISMDGSNISEYIIVNVKMPITNISLSNNITHLAEKSSVNLTYSVTPPNTNKINVSWKSNNTYVAEVNEFGVLKANNEGSADITVTTKDGTNKSDTLRITVYKQITNMTFLNKPYYYTLEPINMTSYINIKPNIPLLNNYTLSFTSSDKNVATINNSMIKYVSLGKTMVSAKLKDNNTQKVLTTNTKITVGLDMNIYFYNKSSNLYMTKKSQIDIPIYNLGNNKLTVDSNDLNIANGFMSQKNNDNSIKIISGKLGNTQIKLINLNNSNQFHTINVVVS